MGLCFDTTNLSVTKSDPMKAEKAVLAIVLGVIISTAIGGPVGSILGTLASLLVACS